MRTEIERARAVLPMLRLRLDKEGPAVARRYGGSVVEVAQALARALGIPQEAVVSGGSLEPAQLEAALADLAAADKRCREHLAGASTAARALAADLIFACEIFTHLYQLRLHAVSLPDQQRGEVEALAETYASLTRVLGEIAAQDRRS